MKAMLKVLLYVGLSTFGLLVFSVLVFWAWLRWEYHLPSEQTARQEFVSHRADYVRFVSLLQQDPGAKVIDINGEVDAYTSHARYVPEYYALMRRIGAKRVMVREDGSVEFQIWGFGCAPCSDSYMGMRYSPIDGQPQHDGGWAPKLVNSLNDTNLPKDKGAVADGLYVIPLDREWSIYRLEISD
jgi:hypothetical protein